MDFQIIFKCLHNDQINVFNENTILNKNCSNSNPHRHTHTFWQKTKTTLYNLHNLANWYMAKIMHTSFHTNNEIWTILQIEEVTINLPELKQGFTIL